MKTKAFFAIALATRWLPVMLCLVAIAGCDRSKKAEADAASRAQATPPANRPAAPIEELEPLPGALPPAAGPGDAAWIQMFRDIEMPTPPA